MERRVFVAILLSFAVLYGYQALFVPPQKPAIDVVEPEQRKPEPPPSSAASPSTPEPPREPEPAAQTSESSEREIVVDTATTRIVLSNRGGRVLHWRLKEYQTNRDEPVDLIPSGTPADQPKPFTLTVDDPALTTRLNGA